MVGSSIIHLVYCGVATLIFESVCKQPGKKTIGRKKSKSTCVCLYVLFFTTKLIWRQPSGLYGTGLARRHVTDQSHLAQNLRRAAFLGDGHAHTQKHAIYRLLPLSLYPLTHKNIQSGMSEKQQTEMHPRGLIKQIIAISVFLEMPRYKTSKWKVGSFLLHSGFGKFLGVCLSCRMLTNSPEQNAPGHSTGKDVNDTFEQ